MEIEQARQTADCMARVLRSTNGAQNVKTAIAYGYKTASPMIGYDFRGETGDAHTVWLRTSPAGDQGYAFEDLQLSLSKADPAQAVLSDWETKCRVFGVLVAQ
jgi:hypothetical protein